MPTRVDDAVGVQRPRWYVAIVNHRSEKITADRLTELGHECYVASRKEHRVWKNGRRVEVDHVVIPSMIFVRCTEAERLSIVTLPYIFRFLTNKAAATGKMGKPVAIIPESQMERLKFMLGNSDRPVDFVDHIYGKGDHVRVIRGGLCGLEGEVLTTHDGRSELLVRLDILGCARVTIDPVDIEPVE